MTSQSHSMWIHGHSVQVQSPDKLSVERCGFFARIGKAKEVDTTYWFHFAIPTPVSVGNEPLGVESAIIRFRTSSSSGKTIYMTVHVVAVHVYDGEVCIGRYDNLDLKQNYWKNATIKFSLPKDLSFGLGISVGVEFVGEKSFNPIEPGYIDFSGAGACFVDPRIIIAKQPHSILFMTEHPDPSKLTL